MSVCRKAWRFDSSLGHHSPSVSIIQFSRDRYCHFVGDELYIAKLPRHRLHPGVLGNTYHRLQLLCPEPFAVCEITRHSLCLRLNSSLCTPLLSRSCSVVVCSCALRGLLCLSCRRFPAMPLSEPRTINPLF